MKMVHIALTVPMCGLERISLLEPPLCHQDAELFPQFDVNAAFALIVESIDPRDRSTFLRNMNMTHKFHRNMFLLSELRKLHTGSRLLQPEISRWIKTGIKYLRTGPSHMVPTQQEKVLWILDLEQGDNEDD